MVIREGLTLPIVSVQARAVLQSRLRLTNNSDTSQRESFKRRSTRHDSEKITRMENRERHTDKRSNTD